MGYRNTAALHMCLTEELFGKLHNISCTKNELIRWGFV